MLNEHLQLKECHLCNSSGSDKPGTNCNGIPLDIFSSFVSSFVFSFVSSIYPFAYGFSSNFSRYRRWHLFT